jgi:hypothetical protein
LARWLNGQLPFRLLVDKGQKRHCVAFFP